MDAQQRSEDDKAFDGSGSQSVVFRCVVAARMAHVGQHYYVPLVPEDGSSGEGTNQKMTGFICVQLSILLSMSDQRLLLASLFSTALSMISHIQLDSRFVA